MAGSGNDSTNDGADDSEDKCPFYLRPSFPCFDVQSTFVGHFASAKHSANNQTAEGTNNCSDSNAFKSCCDNCSKHI